MITKGTLGRCMGPIPLKQFNPDELILMSCQFNPDELILMHV